MRRLSSIAMLCITLASCQSTKTTTGTPSTKGTQHIATLQNTYWQLTEINGTPTTTPPDGNETHIKLLQGDKLEGYAGCNKIGGSYTEGAKNVIKFTPLSTLMACENMTNENYLLNALRNANRYKIKDGMLYLYKDKEELIFLKAMFF